MTEVAVRQEPFRLLAELEEAGALSPVGLRLTDPAMPYARFESLLRLLGGMHTAVRFAVGDALLFGEAVYGDEVYQAAGLLGVSEGAQMDWMRVARKVPLERRRAGLSWRHHRAVAPIEDAARQEEMLTRALEEQLSSRDLERLLRDMDDDLSRADADTRRGTAEPTLDLLRPDEERAVSVYRDLREARGEAAALAAVRALAEPPVSRRCPACGAVVNG